MYKPHLHCRACGFGENKSPDFIKAARSSERLIPVMELGVQPLANDFCSENSERAGFAPLKAMYCPHCSLVQLDVVVDPKVIYNNYPYVTSRSDTMIAHFHKLWHAIKLECRQPENVLEIGSNDGYFLQFARANGADRVLGIDPAQNLVSQARGDGIETICDTFNFDSASIASGAMPRVDVVVARHVFCHVDNWHEFIKNLDGICHKETLIVIEVPYIKDQMNALSFDQFYHEHLSYMSVTAMEAMLRHTPFRLQRVVHFQVHGGAIALMLRRCDSDMELDSSVEEFSNDRITLDDWLKFSERSHRAIDALRNMVRNESAPICGFGASAKSTVWINACGFTRKDIRFVCDSTPGKQWKYIPGTDIPVVDEGALLREVPDYAILFAWNYKDEVLKKNSLWRSKGGKFVIPIPELTVV